MTGLPFLRTLSGQRDCVTAVTDISFVNEYSARWWGEMTERWCIPPR